MAGDVRHGKTKKSPPILSHEFVIQNHGDIISCVIMLIMLGLIFQVTTPYAQIFIVPQYNQTISLPAENLQPEQHKVSYRNGLLDLASVFFYTLTLIALHCVLQEYFFDKVSKRLHLSRSKQVKFNESSHLLVFSAYSFVHLATILNELGIHKDFTSLWSGYPDLHRNFSLSTKLFFIVQISFWLHQFPEFYFQKLKREEILNRLTYVLIFLVSASFFYCSNFNRLGMLLLFFEYASQFIFHFSRLLYFSNKIDTNMFKPWNVTFIFVRLATIVSSILTLWFGFRSQPEALYVDFSTGNWNTSFIRINALLLIILVQLYALFNFCSFQMRRLRELRRQAALIAASQGKSKRSGGQGIGGRSAKKIKANEENAALKKSN